MTVSIIIAVKTWQNNLEECIDRCLELDYSNFEILILPDSEGTIPAEAITSKTKGAVPIKVIPTGRVSPAKKRDMALNYAKGEILAFIDDDAYPKKDWLKNAIKNFVEPDVVAVGGPAITPAQDNLRQKASGLVYSSFMVSGNYVYRYLPMKRCQVDDYPSCNFLVRRTTMQELGGFKTNLWPGEDTKLSLDITKSLNKKIIYDPEVLVYHHRRPLFVSHLRQVANYALHRGYFVKKYPATSLRFPYFIPSLFLLFLFAGWIFSLFFWPLKILYTLVLSLYLVLALFFSIKQNLYFLPLVFLGIILTHLTYGIYFLKGLLLSKLKEE